MPPSLTTLASLLYYQCPKTIVFGYQPTFGHPTDGWPSYHRLLPREHHTKGRGGTLRVEQQHLNFRTRIKRLQRRTICFSKSDKMHDAVIKLYIHHSNTSQHQF
jgi:IS1 family transposase